MKTIIFLLALVAVAMCLGEIIPNGPPSSANVCIIQNDAISIDGPMMEARLAETPFLQDSVWVLSARFVTGMIGIDQERVILPAIARLAMLGHERGAPTEIRGYWRILDYSAPPCEGRLFEKRWPYPILS